MRNRKLPRGVFERRTAAGSLLIYFGVSLSEAQSRKFKLPHWPIRPAPSIEAAVVARSEAKLRLRRGEHPFPEAKASAAPSAGTVRDLVEAFLAISCNPAVEDLPKHQLKHRHARTLTEYLGGNDAGSLTLADLDEFAQSRASAATGRRPGPATIKLDLSFLRAAFNSGKEAGTVTRSVFDSIGRQARKRLMPPIPKKFQRVSDEDLSAILENMGEQYRRPVLFLLETGTRAAEAFGLEWPQINVKADTARLTDTKSGKPRSVPLSPRAHDLLGKRPKAGGFVFKGPGGDSMLPSVEKAWSRACKAAGIKRRIHDLRGEFACRYMERGGTMEEAREICGWSSLEVVARYMGSLESRKRTVLARPWRLKLRPRRKVAKVLQVVPAKP